MSSPLSIYQTAIAADAARYAAQLDGSYLARRAELDNACGDAWRAHRKSGNVATAPSEAQALGFTALD